MSIKELHEALRNTDYYNDFSSPGTIIRAYIRGELEEGRLSLDSMIELTRICHIDWFLLNTLKNDPRVIEEVNLYIRAYLLSNWGCD